MIRIVVTVADAGMAVNVGGPVVVTARTFDVEAPELEAFLAKGHTYETRFVSAAEIRASAPVSAQENAAAK